MQARSKVQGMLSAMFKGIRKQTERCKFRKAQCKSCIDETVTYECVKECKLKCHEKKILGITP